MLKVRHFLYTFCHVALILQPGQSKLNQPPHQLSSHLSRLFLHMYRTPSSLFIPPCVFPVFQLQSLLTLISFVSSKLSQHLSLSLCSSLFFSSPLLPSLLENLSAMLDFPHWFLGPRFPFFFSFPGPVVHSLFPSLTPPSPPNPPNGSHVSRIPE